VIECVLERSTKRVNERALERALVFWLP